MNARRHRAGRPRTRRGLVRRSSQGVGGHGLRSAKRERGLVLRSAKREAGFTLIEMLAVLAVMGVLFGVAIVGFNQFGRGRRLESAGRLIQKHLDLARRAAVTRRAIYGVQFEPRDEPERDRLRVYYKDTKSGDPLTLGKYYELPPGVEFGDKSGGNMPPTDSDGIRFKRTGSTLDADTFKVHDVETEKGRTITVEAVTGRTKVD